jgi:nucleotide-binding universal stress UspA family protein
MNAYKQLLVHLDDSARNMPRLRAARAIAASHGSMVAACYAVTSSYLEAAYGAEVAPALLASLAEWDDGRRDRARQTFEAEMGTPGPAVGWSEVKGIGCSMEFARQAFHADLLVLGQRDPSAPAGASGDFNETVMLASGKPTLVMPYVGWDARNACAGSGPVCDPKHSPCSDVMSAPACWRFTARERKAARTCTSRSAPRCAAWPTSSRPGRGKYSCTSCPPGC